MIETGSGRTSEGGAASIADVELEMSSTASAAYRAPAEEAIQTLARRSASATAARVADAARCAERHAAISAPLMRIVEADPAAREALLAERELRRRSAERLRPVESPAVGQGPVAPNELYDVMYRSGWADQVNHAPFDYAWSWGGGFGVTNAANGVIQQNAYLPAGPSWHDMHGGIGKGMTVDQECTVTARTLTSVNKWEWELKTWWDWGGNNATTEGGVEMTVLEGATLLGVGQSKLWRARASQGEDKGGSGTPGVAPDTTTVTWRAFPGHIYNVNVGVWVFLETQGESASAYGSIDATVLFLSMFLSP